jgi:glucokinase
MAVIALDLGGTKLAGAVFASNGRSFARALSPLAGRTGRKVGALIIEQIEGLMAAACAKEQKLEAIGISVPGLSYADGSVWAPNIAGWKRYPLKDEVRRFAKSSPSLKGVPIVVENDRACYILGERWRGIAKGCDNAIFMAVGTGIGAGILVDGRVLNGSSGTAGSIGWMGLDRPFHARYKGVGCFEYHASGAGLARTFKTQKAGESPLTAADVFKSASRGDKAAQEHIASAIECWGMAVANLVSLFNPEKIIFGGGVFGPAVRFLPQIRREARKWAQPLAIRQTEICASKLGPDAGLFGAGFAALQACNKTHAPI